MELVPTLISAGWAAGVNAYLTVALMSLLGRAGVGDVPEELQSDGVLIAALVLYAIEFVVDKVPLLDSTWDAVHTIVRPAIASAVGVELGSDAGAVGVEQIFAGGGAGALAFASHAVKAGHPAGGEHVAGAGLEHLHEPARGRPCRGRDDPRARAPGPRRDHRADPADPRDRADGLPRQAHQPSRALPARALGGALAAA